MRKFSLAALAATAMIALAAPAAATDFSFVGTFGGDDDVILFNFTVGAPSTVTLRTYSYAGGVNAAGAAIARGGFDPTLALYNSAGSWIAGNDDGLANVPADPATNEHFDNYLSQLLGPGSYTVAISQWDNYAPNLVTTPFPGSDQTGFTDILAKGPRDGHWALDVLNVDSAFQIGVPEPATWGLMIAGFGMTGAMLRRRRQAAATT
jgi:hypothetical protein